MAVRVHAAALHSSYRLLVYSLLIDYVSLSITYAQTHMQEHVKYSRNELIIIGLIPGDCIYKQEDPTHEIPSELVRLPGSPWITLPAGKQRRRCRERKQKRGCRSGIQARLDKDPHKPPLPSLFVTNAR